MEAAMCSSQPIKQCPNSVCLITGNIYFDELIMMVLGMFLHWELSFSLCNKLLCGAELFITVMVTKG